MYLFAVVTLAIATRAVHGGRLALRLLTATALILFLERAFSPFALRVFEPVALALHVLAAFVALALALASARSASDPLAQPPQSSRITVPVARRRAIRSRPRSAACAPEGSPSCWWVTASG